MKYDADIDKPIPRRGPRRFGVTYLRWSCEAVRMNVRDSLRFPGFTRYRIVAQPAICVFGDVYNVGESITASITAIGEVRAADLARVVAEMERLSFATGDVQ